MDWARAKTIFIILFLGLNIFLLYNIMQQDSNRIIISEEEINDVKAILSAHNIELGSEVPKKIQPNSFLKIEGIEYYEKDLVNKFFGKEVKKSKGDGFSIYKDKDKKLEIYDSRKLIYYNVTNNNLSSFSKNKIIRYVENELINLSIYPTYGVLSQVIKTNDGYIIKYSQEYNDYKIFGSYLYVTVTNSGISKIESYWTNPIEFVDEPKDIKTPTEIFLVFAKDIRNTNKIAIKEINLGYYPPIEEIKNGVVSAVPVWEIVTNEGVHYYYNAYEGYLENSIAK